MNPDPDYSAAYLQLSTSDADLIGHGFAFAIGRGNDIQVAAIEALAGRLVGRDFERCGQDAATKQMIFFDSPNETEHS
jgi:L-fuconate dehydratase